MPAELVALKCKCYSPGPTLCRADDPRVGVYARCPSCRKPYARDLAAGFGAAEWERETDPAKLRQVLRLMARPVTPRVLRLGACWVCRTEFEWCRNPRFLEAVAVGEAFADAECSERDRAKAYQYLRDVPATNDWRAAALWCVAPEKSPSAGGELRWVELPAEWFRETVGNPFDRVRFDPEWRTSTVLDLARVMVRRRTFHLFPYLSDALQDAGCDDARVRAHCESNRPHGRGCWLLDAILSVPSDTLTP